MNDLNEQAAAPKISAEAIEKFTDQAEVNLTLFRTAVDKLMLNDDSQPIAISLAAALIAAEIAAMSGSTSGRSLGEVMELLSSMLADMQNHAQRTFETYEGAKANAAVEDMAFREVATNDA